MLAACPEDKEPVMSMIFELVTMVAVFALGLVLGRIWEIRQEFRRDQSHRRHAANREHRADGGLAGDVQSSYRLPTARL
jgi:hypothetical protein